MAAADIEVQIFAGARPLTSGTAYALYRGTSARHMPPPVSNTTCKHILHSHMIASMSITHNKEYQQPFKSQMNT